MTEPGGSFPLSRHKQFGNSKEMYMDAGDAAVALAAGEPSFQCPACLDTFRASQAFEVGCAQAHRFCIDDMKRHAESRLRSNEIPTCPMCSYSSMHEFSEAEVTRLFGRGQLHSLFLDISIKNALANSRDTVACPTPDCKQYLVLNGSARQRVDCPTCKAIFCSECRELYHHNMSCAELRATASRWLRWQAGGRVDYLTKLNGHTAAGQELASSQRRVRDAGLKLQQLYEDETWKERHLRLCPHCQRPVERIDGCGAMVCGRDADDKGAGNRQAGCMKPFQWDRAAPYKSDMAPADADRPLTEAEAVWGDIRLKDCSPSGFGANLLPYRLQPLIPTPPVGRRERRVTTRARQELCRRSVPPL